MSAQKNILHTIERNMSSFSKGQKLIAQYILENYDKAAFMTANRLGKAVHVSESTVVRFASELGYDGYPSMQRALQEKIRGKLTSLQRIEASTDTLSGESLVNTVLQRDMEKIRMAVDQIEPSEFDRVVSKIIAAKHIYIIGVRSSYFLAGYLNFYYRMIFENVTQVETSSSGVFDQIFRISAGDVVVAISYPRYSEDTLKVCRFARDRGAEVVAITDSEMSPLSQFASVSLMVRNEMLSFVDSLAAPMSLLNALILVTAQQVGADVSRNFKELEEVWERHGIFRKIEDD